MTSAKVLPLKSARNRYHKLFRVLGGVLGVFLGASFILYGIVVFFEHQVINIGNSTRNLNEDNQSLQISLDKLRSYQKIAVASSKFQGLKTATEVMDTVQKPLSRPVLQEDKPYSIPVNVYGY